MPRNKAPYCILNCGRRASIELTLGHDAELMPRSPRWAEETRELVRSPACGDCAKHILRYRMGEAFGPVPLDLAGGEAPVRNRTKPEWTKSSGIGDIFTRKEFLESAKSHSIMDDDGCGYFARLQGSAEALAAFAALGFTWESFSHCKRLGITVEEHSSVHVARIAEGRAKWPTGATHVVWCNK